MLTKLLMISAIATAAALVFGGVSFAGASGTTDRTLTAIATHVHFTTADVGATGDSPGDELVFTAKETDLDGNAVGRLDGYCVFTRTPSGHEVFEECLLAHVLTDGQITLQGSFDQSSSDNQEFAVTGGTGAYEEAQGQAILRFTHRFRFDIELES